MIARKRTRPSRDQTAMLLEFIAGVLTLPPDAKEPQRVALAARVDLPAETAARIFGKTPGAIGKAMQRAKK